MRTFRCNTDKCVGGDAPIKNGLYTEDFTWGNKTVTVGEIYDRLRVSRDWILIEEGKEEFKLPDDWVVKGTPETADILSKFKLSKGRYAYSGNHPYVDQYGTGWSVTSSYHTEITFEQFEKYVLMKDKKEIIGYKVKPEFNKFAKILCETSRWLEFACGSDFQSNSGYSNTLQKADVLDLWCDPVYKKEFELPVINGHSGEIKGDIVKYGCAEFKIKSLEELYILSLGNRAIKSIELSSDVTVTMEEIGKILKYYAQ